MNSTTLLLAKQNFKFSAGHFLIFNQEKAEKLHGHNYQVKVDVVVPPEADLEKQGYYIDFNEFKKIIKARVDEWDEVVLLPNNHPDMRFREEAQNLHVNFRERYYVFPKNEVVLLPVTNTSVEQLARLLGDDLYRAFKKFGVKEVTVVVEETIGQGASVTVKD